MRSQEIPRIATEDWASALAQLERPCHSLVSGCLRVLRPACEMRPALLEVSNWGLVFARMRRRTHNHRCRHCEPRFPPYHTPLDCMALGAQKLSTVPAGVCPRLKTGDSPLPEIQPRRICKDWHPRAKEVGRNL